MHSSGNCKSGLLIPSAVYSAVVREEDIYMDATERHLRADPVCD